MLFNSLHFVFFFIIVTTIYFALAHKFRWIWLLAASCYFYMAFIPVYILILAGTIVIDYFAGIWIENAYGKKKKGFLIISLIANIGLLAVFKYYNFFIDNINPILNSIGLDNKLPYLSIILPIGLSFHTFQAMSYTIEVYRGNQKAERHFGIYALYVMFYPQLVAGPIERPQNLLHQFREKKIFDYKRVIDGLKIILWGLFMKVVIADRLSIYVDSVYHNSEYHGGKSLALATVFFAFQIYCDFSGYSNIAIGSAKVMGIDLMTNFNRPYLSRSVSEFWKRWHISLSTWFRDYVYVNLGGNRVGIWRWYLNLFIVFLISGLWHGPNWTFVMWGALNGLYLIIEIMLSRLQVRPFLPAKAKVLKSVILTSITFILICISWVFFRSENVTQAFKIIAKILLLDGDLFIGSTSILLYGVFGLAILFLHEIGFQEKLRSLRLFSSINDRFYNYAKYSLMVILILMIGVFDGGQFIYFQF